jgi:hypothetical protein
MHRILLYTLSIFSFLFFILFYFSYLTVAPILYPLLIDSNYVKLQNENLISQTTNDTIVNPVHLLYHPSQLNISVEEIKCIDWDKKILNGWYYNKPVNPNGTAILILHDINESKISWMESCRIFNELGFYVFCFDLHSHGNNTPEVYAIDNKTVNAVQCIIDTIYCRAEINNLAIIGSGFNAVLAATVIKNNSAKVLILQDPVSSMSHFLSEQTEIKWGRLQHTIFPVAQLIYDFKTGMSADSLNLAELITNIAKPTLITVTQKSVQHKDVADALLVFEKSNAPIKKIWTDKAKGFITNMYDEEKNYSRAVAAFINSNIPSETKSKKQRKKIVDL